MLRSSFALLKGLLKGDKTLLSFLSQETVDQLSFIEEAPPKFESFSYQGLTEDVHYSWYLKIFKLYPKNIQEIFLYVLDEGASEKLEKLLKIKKQKKALKKKIVPLFQNIIKKEIVPPSLLPKKYLPPSKLSPLLDLSKKELVKLIDFLALFDLAIEIPKIVEKDLLKKIDKFLSKEKLSFLKSILPYKEPFSFPPLNIKRFKKSKKDFQTLLHKRGLIRFSEAISVQDKDMIWYICHKLDVGRGEALLKLSRKKSKISKYIETNIETILPIITKEG